MSRLFNNNAANYMSRGSVNLGLDGLTECSFACWVNISSTQAFNQRVVSKENSTGWNTILTAIASGTTALVCAVENFSLSQSPSWQLSAGIGTGVWVRMLFTWKRNAITAADGVIYINGVAQSTSYTAGGYTGAFVIAENTSELTYGVQANTHGVPLSGSLAWVCVWNRQLSSTEALVDYNDARSVSEGRLHCVECSYDTDISGYGNDMTVNGTLVDAGFEPTQREGSFLNMAQADYPGAGPKSPMVRFYKSPTGTTRRSVVFRKTLSSIGSRTGSRQVHQT